MNDRINHSLNSLRKSKFRSKFKLSQKNRDYIATKGLETIIWPCMILSDCPWPFQCFLIKGFHDTEEMRKISQILFSARDGREVFTPF